VILCLAPVTLFAIACSTAQSTDRAPPPRQGGVRTIEYGTEVARLEAVRRRLAGEHRRARTAPARRAVLARARDAVFAGVADRLLPAWFGTPWSFNGTTETPRRGQIACGYLVTTVLRDAGFRVERARLAQQASERIIRTLVPEGAIRRFRNRPVAEVVGSVRARGTGLYLVGLDNHVGFLVARAGRVEFCHASWAPPGAATCEPAREALAMVSRYHVVGKLLGPYLLRRWLAGSLLRTRTD
jgi:hypothetical protein